MSHRDETLVRQLMERAERLKWEPFRRQLDQPTATQSAVLQEILQENRATRFGRTHGFAKIKSSEDFVRSVPIQTYEDLRPYIERQDERKTPELTKLQPVR